MQSSPLADLLAVNSRQALEFFYWSLYEVLTTKVRKDELLYNAGLLSHYAHTSCYSDSDGFPCPRTLEVVFEQHVCSSDGGGALHKDLDFLEVVGGQTLFLTGFFKTRMGRRHNINWYRSLGASFYRNVAKQADAPETKEFFARMSLRFSFWADVQSQLEDDLRKRPYLLRLPDGFVH